MTDILLRPYQQRFIDDVRNEFRHHKRVVGVAPCGAGKTIMAGWMLRQAALKGKRSIFFVHRKELIDQSADTFTRLNIPFGFISANKKTQSDLPVQIASVQSLANRLNDIQPPDFLVCDECHHILADSYRKIIDAFPNAFLLGVTATPIRYGGKSLSDVFSALVNSLSVNQLIQLGNLSKFQYFAPDIGVDLHNVRSNSFDFIQADLLHVMSNQKIINGVVEQYSKFAINKSAICYCVNVSHSKAVADAFVRAGFSAAHLDANSSKSERERIVNAFRQNQINILCNADLFGEGFDVPHCQAVILARPTKSLALFIQQALRPLRPDPDDPNKLAVIIDLVQNYLRHGLPNFEHHWNLDPNPPKSIKQPPVKICPNCSAVVHISQFSCPDCGYIFPVNNTVHESLPEQQLNLAPVNVSFQFNNPEQKQRIIHALSTPEQFLAFANANKYQIGWVAHQSLKFATSFEDCLHIARVCGYKPGWAWYKWNNLQSDFLAKKVASGSSFD